MTHDNTKLELDDLLTKIMGVSRETIEMLLEGGGDAIAVYTVYYFIAKWEQKSGKIKCKISDLVSRLKISENRVTKARSFIMEKGLISDILEKDKNNKIIGMFVKINYQPVVGTPVSTTADELKTKYGQFVTLSPIEYNKLCADYGIEQTKSFITDLDVHIGSLGDKYSSHYFTLLSRFRRKGIKPNHERKLIQPLA